MVTWILVIILCPAVSETHRGGSTDLEKGVRSNAHRMEEGRKEVTGMERTQAAGEDQLHLGAGYKSRMQCA